MHSRRQIFIRDSGWYKQLLLTIIKNQNYKIRFLLGVAISAVPVYLSEITSHDIRGQTVAITSISISKF
jgi:hypothetical protein